MLYDSLKIFHIISATLLLTSMGYSYHLWRNIYTPQDVILQGERIQTQTWMIIIPIALLQLATGLTMISLHEEDFSQTWIVASVVGFIVVVGSWFSFIYFLVLSQQASNEKQINQHIVTAKYKFFRRAQFFMLSVCAVALFSMVFVMANKI
jgi:uncharacterized membrane protein